MRRAAQILLTVLTTLAIPTLARADTFTYTYTYTYTDHATNFLFTRPTLITTRHRHHPNHCFFASDAKSGTIAIDPPHGTRA